MIVIERTFDTLSKTFRRGCILWMNFPVLCVKETAGDFLKLSTNLNKKIHRVKMQVFCSGFCLSFTKDETKSGMESLGSGQRVSWVPSLEGMVDELMRACGLI